MNPTKYTDLEHESEERMTPLVETLWPAGESGIISGPPEAGKTWYAFAEAIGLALGLPVLGTFAVPARKRILFYEEEANGAANRRRVHAVLRAYGASERLYELCQWLKVVSFHGVRLCDPEHVAELGRVIDDSKAEVVYLDSFFRMMPGQDLAGNKAATLALSNLDNLARQHSVVFRIVHHDTKAGDSLYGSQALMAWRRDGLQISEGGKLRYQGNNAGPLLLGRMQLDFDDETGSLTAATCELVATAAAKVAQALSDTPTSVEAIAKIAKVSESSVKQILPKLAASRLAEPAGKAPAGANGGRPAMLWRTPALA
jgi:AAA domain